MRKLLPLLWLLCCGLLPARAQYCSPDNRFSQLPVFATAQIDSSLRVRYGQALNYQGQQQQLTFNIYYPDTLVDPLPRRPFILMVHGGSFLTGTGDGLNATCREFARRGYVAATLDYRLGWAAGTTCLTRDTTSQSLAAYRGVQDAHAALRYLAAHARAFRIDTTWLFMGGNSAGAFITDNLVFMSQANYDAYAPYAARQLGNINASGNTLTTRFRIRGIFQNWGALINTKYITAANAVPMIAFHGQLDDVAPLDSGRNACPNGVFVYGSRCIYRRLVQLGQCAELNVKLRAGHGVYNDTPAQDLFRIGRAACFFRSLFCRTCTTVARTDSVPASCARPLAVVPAATPEPLTAYPNPATNRLYLSGLPPAAPDVWLTIVNALGQVVLTARARPELDVAALPAGLYVLRLTAGAAPSQAVRFVKE